MRTSREKTPTAPEAPLRVVLVGIDDRARILARAILSHPELELVAAVGPKGKKLPEAPRLPVFPRADEAYRRARGGVAVLAEGHHLEAIERDLLGAIDAGLSVVALCEELIHASFADPSLADRIDAAAARRGVAVLGVGLYPGFFFDRLASTAARAVGLPQRAEAERVVDAARGLARLAGIGLDERAFEAALEEEKLGQRGLSEACGLLGEALGFELDEIEEVVDPLLAEAAVEAGGIRVEAGRLKGLRQLARGFEEGKEVVRLQVRMELGVEAVDRLRIEGTPPLELTIPGGLPEDPSLGWVVAHALAQLADLPPGLRSVLDLPAA